MICQCAFPSYGWSVCGVLAHSTPRSIMARDLTTVSQTLLSYLHHRLPNIPVDKNNIQNIFRVDSSFSCFVDWYFLCSKVS